MQCKMGSIEQTRKNKVWKPADGEETRKMRVNRIDSREICPFETLIGPVL